MTGLPQVLGVSAKMGFPRRLFDREWTPGLDCQRRSVQRRGSGHGWAFQCRPLGGRLPDLVTVTMPSRGLPDMPAAIPDPGGASAGEQEASGA
ncbi:MAG: hypothetical protein QOH05_2566 [Acetobacteraceae bacterium]|nr:hypothetical protein [Acetobacteraceae bacterium]